MVPEEKVHLICAVCHEMHVESISVRGKTHLWQYLVKLFVFLDHSLLVYSSRTIDFRSKN